MSIRISRPLSRYPLALAAACCLGLPLAAQAELSNESLIGPGLRSKPAYDGSDSQKTELVPVVRYFGQGWFVRSTQGVLEAGPRIELAPGLNVAAQVAYEPGRRTGDSDFLEARNFPTLGRSASVGAQIEWDQKFGPVPVTLLARARKDIHRDRGAQVDLRASAGVFQSGPVSAGIFVQGIWASAKSAESYYGVTAAQAVTSGLPAYRAGSGWINYSAGLLGSFDVSPKWVVVGSLEERRLAGDARRSPLAERKSNHYVSAGLAYKF